MTGKQQVHFTNYQTWLEEVNRDRRLSKEEHIGLLDEVITDLEEMRDVGLEELGTDLQQFRVEHGG